MKMKRSAVNKTGRLILPYGLPAFLICIRVCFGDGVATGEASTRLTGKEILAELQYIGPTTRGRPGIYAFLPDGSSRLVVPCGRKPVWSPDRKHFTFLRSDPSRTIPPHDAQKVCVYSCETGRISILSLLTSYASYSGPPILSGRPAFSSHLYWYSNDAVVAWSSDLPWFPGLLLLPGRRSKPLHAVKMPVPGPVIPDAFRLILRPWTAFAPLLDPEYHRVIVGRLSVRTDGAVAYERWRKLEKYPAMICRTAVFDAQNRSVEELRIPGLSGHEHVLMPVWNPKVKDVLGVSLVHPDFSRECLVVSVGDKGRCRILRRFAANRKCPGGYTFEEWSANGEDFLMRGWKVKGPNSVTYLIKDYLFCSLTAKAAPASFTRASCVHFSPDGKWVASLGGDMDAVSPDGLHFGNGGGWLEAYELKRVDGVLSGTGRFRSFKRIPNLRIVFFDW